MDGGGELQQRRRPLLSPSLSLAQRTREPLLLGPPPPVLQAHPWGERRDGGGGGGEERRRQLGSESDFGTGGVWKKKKRKKGETAFTPLAPSPLPHFFPLLAAAANVLPLPSFLPPEYSPQRIGGKKKKERGVTTAGIFFPSPSSVSAADDDGPNPVISIPRQFQSALAVPKISLPPLSKKVAKKFRGHSTRNPLFRSGKKPDLVVVVREKGEEGKPTLAPQFSLLLCLDPIFGELADGKGGHCAGPSSPLPFSLTSTKRGREEDRDFVGLLGWGRRRGWESSSREV